MHSHKMVRPMQPLQRGVSPVSLALAAVLAMGLAYAVVLAQPSLVHALRGVFPLGSGAPPWVLPVAAAGIAVAGGAIGVIALSTVARLAQRNPFLWLGPVLVAFTMIVLAGVNARLPWPAMPLPAFASLSGLALLGGGAVLQMPGRAGRVAGALLISLPLSSLIVGYAVSPLGFANSMSASGAQGGALVTVILGLTSVGVAATALIARAEDLETVARMRAVLEQQRLQLIDAIEVGRLSEARVRDAERRMELLEHGIMPSHADDDAALRAMKGGAQSSSALQWALTAAAAMLCLACGALYFGLYQPAARKLQAQSAVLAQISGKHAAELAAVRTQAESQKSSFAAAMDTERSGIESARAAVEDAQKKLAACEQGAAAPAKEKEKAELAPAKEKAEVVPAPSRSVKRKAARAARKTPPRKTAVAAPAPARAAIPERPDSPELDAKTKRALRESESRNDDDPLSGL
jgi:hypothetical protein